MTTNIKLQTKTDETEIRQLTEKWRSIWSPKDKPFTGKGLENIFATGEKEIVVFDNYGSDLVVLHSLQEYLDTWIPAMQNFSYWEVQLEDNLAISIDGNLAVTTFSFAGGGKSKDGKEAKLRQLGTHMWKRLNGEWRLVHEHLTAG